MNRYEKENAADKINGYYFPSQAKSANAFESAKSECLSKLYAQIEKIKALTEKEFLSLI